MKKRLLTLVAILSLILPNVIQSEKISIVTGSKLGTYANIGFNLKQVCKNLDINLFESAGSTENVWNIVKKPDQVNFGITQLDVLYLFKTLYAKKEKDISKLFMVFPLYFEEIHILATKKSDIKSLSDLNGKVVNTGAEGSGTNITSLMISKIAGLKFKQRKMKTGAALKSLLKGKIDAMIYVIGQPVPILEKLNSKVNKLIHMITVSHPQLSKIYIETTIPSYTYPWQANGVKTYKIPSILITHQKTSAAKIKALTNCTMKNLKFLKEHKHKKWKEVNPHLYKEIEWQMHPVSKKIIDAFK